MPIYYPFGGDLPIEDPAGMAHSWIASSWFQAHDMNAMNHVTWHMEHIYIYIIMCACDPYLPLRGDGIVNITCHIIYIYIYHKLQNECLP